MACEFRRCFEKCLVTYGPTSPILLKTSLLNMVYPIQCIFLGRKEMEFVNSGDAMKLKRAVEGRGWQTDMFTKEIKQDVTSILSGSEKGMTTLGYMLEIKDIDKKLRKKDLENIIKEIEETSNFENTEENGEKFVTSSNNIFIFYT